jgi:hypothetical protein
MTSPELKLKKKPKSAKKSKKNDKACLSRTNEKMKYELR